MNNTGSSKYQAGGIKFHGISSPSASSLQSSPFEMVVIFPTALRPPAENAVRKVPIGGESAWIVPLEGRQARFFGPLKRLDVISNILDAPSMIKDGVPSLNERIAVRVRELRAAHGFSLEALSRRSGVSRSLISLIERAECSPTAVVLEKLATALGVVLASLFDARPDKGHCEPVSRRAVQPEWKDPDSGYIRRNLSPAWMPQPMRLVEVEFPAGARVAFESAQQERRVYQQVWVLEGAIQVTVGSDSHELCKGDCMANVLDRPIMFYNPTQKTTRYLVVLTTELQKNGATYALKGDQAVGSKRKVRSIAKGNELTIGA